MGVNVRVRNGMQPDGYGAGGVTEADLRGGLLDLIVGSGVIGVALGRLLVHEKSSPNMSVVIDKGVGYIPNTAFDEYDSDSIKAWEAVAAGTEASRTLVIGANSSGSTRIDLVCLKLVPATTPDSSGSNIASLVIVAGTPGAGQPATPDYHLLLATVSVANGASSIVNASITDKRAQVRLKPEVSISNDNYVEYTPAGGATSTLDLSKSNDHWIQFPAGNISLLLTNARVGQKFFVSLTQDSGGSRLVSSWFSGFTIRWVGGTAPVLTLTGLKRDEFGFKVRSANTLDGFVVGTNI